MSGMQDRGGRPVIRLDEAAWQLVWECARLGLSQAIAAARVGVSVDTLERTEGFAEAWRRKKAEQLTRLAAALNEAATREVAPTMPQAVSAMYLAKVHLGWHDRPSEALPAGQLRISIVYGGQPVAQVSVVEGALSQGPLDSTGEGEAPLSLPGEGPLDSTGEPVASGDPSLATGS